MRHVHLVAPQAGGVAVAAPPSLSTDLGDDTTAGGRMAASPTISRSDASGCQPARSGRSIDSHSLQVGCDLVHLIVQ
jgi:hypothetical protein